MSVARFIASISASVALAACGAPVSSQDGGAAADPAAGATADARVPPAPQSVYVQRNLVSDGSVPAEHTDPNLVNAWGLDALATSPWWVADNGTNKSTLYDGEGNVLALVVDVPGAGAGAAPTGLVANPTSDFVITQAGATGPARFLFAGEDGTISGWMRTTPVSTTAVKVVDATASHAIFKGLTLATTSAGSWLYATDFHNARVRVYDTTFHEVRLPPVAFHDPRIPRGFAPFGIHVLQGEVVVTYAKQDADAKDDVQGPGLGFVVAYALDGRLLARLASRGKLNAPWGLALAPDGFGSSSGRLLVGNFGDGRIVSFGLRRGDGPGHGGEADDLDDDGSYLRSASGPIAIEGLWALSFGTGGVAGPATTLFFTAGPNDEAGGLFGRIDLAP